MAQWRGRSDEPREWGHCGEAEVKAVWEGVALCTKCLRKTPGTKEGFEFEGLLLLSQVVACGEGACYAAALENTGTLAGMATDRPGVWRTEGGSD